MNSHQADTLISIIICTCNRAEHLQATLQSLSSIDVPKNVKCELIVVDNASTDQTRAVIEAAQLPNFAMKYVFEPKQGQCQARNSGIAESSGEILLWTDDDVRPPRDWIEKMCRPILEGRCHAVAGGVKMAPHLDRPWMTAEHKAGLAETARLEEFKDGELTEMVGANMAFSREVLARVPSFDTELGPGALGFGDDSLFALQLVQAGYKIGSCLGTYVIHHFDPSRLQRSSYLSTSKKMGHSWAYIDYHWQHKDVVVWPHRWRRPLRWLQWRITRKKEWSAEDGMAQWEINIIFDVYYLIGYSIERKRDRNYEKRGLVKLKKAARPN